jgi:hypothetical protein
VQQLQAALAELAMTARREALSRQRRECFLDKARNVAVEALQEISASAVVAVRAYTRCTVHLGRLLQQETPEQKEPSKLRKTRELASQTALNASIVLFYSWGDALGIYRVAYSQGGVGARGRPRAHDLLRSSYLAVVAVSYYPAPQARHMLYYSTGHVEGAQRTSVHGPG